MSHSGQARTKKAAGLKPAADKEKSPQRLKNSAAGALASHSLAFLLFGERIPKKGTAMKKRYEGTVEENNIEELPDDFFTRAKPASEALPEIFGTETARKLARKSNNSAQKDLKVLTKIRLDAEVLEVF